MFKVVRKEIDLCGRKFSLETGKIARQADGSVLAQWGETSILCNVVYSKKVSPGQDFFPLTVHYQEKYYAVGRIPGGFFKREAKPSEREVLISRLIDRSVRPMFPEVFRNEVQIVCTLLSYDENCEPDTLAVAGAMAAIKLAGLPVIATVAASKIGFINGQFIANPTVAELEASALDLTISGTKSGILMVESEAQEIPEKKMMEALRKAHDTLLPIIDTIDSFADSAGAKAIKVEEDPLRKEIYKLLEDKLSADIKSALAIKVKKDRSAELSSISDKASDLCASFKEKAQSDDEKTNVKTLIGSCFKELEKNVMRKGLLKTKKRIDGRGLDDVRQIEIEVDVLPKVHGSALFTRGETQALVVATLASPSDEQMLDGVNKAGAKERFMLHYNFPGYSVGEVTPLRGPGRREVGHGKLAYKAINPILPAKDAFPYTIRVVSEITESNGSSSMATVCGTSLSLMAAGVPLTKPVSGIAMGLVKEGNDYVVLSDIMGDEDHLGDMDFKVAGTDAGITSLQMDIKTDNVSFEILETALSQANAGRLHILSLMNKVIDKSRSEVNKNAPRISSINIPTDKIGDVIGKQGKVIKKITEQTGSQIEIADDGKISVYATSTAALDDTIKIIRGIVEEPEVGAVYDTKVTEIIDFGAIVEFGIGRSGMIHISEITGRRIPTVHDVLKVGDEVKVRVIGYDQKGRIKLSSKEFLGDASSGENSDDGEEERAPRSRDRNGEERGGRSRDRDNRDSRDGRESRDNRDHRSIDSEEGDREEGEASYRDNYRSVNNNRSGGFGGNRNRSSFDFARRK